MVQNADDLLQDLQIDFKNRDLFPSTRSTYLARNVICVPEWTRLEKQFHFICPVRDLFQTGHNLRLCVRSGFVLANYKSAVASKQCFISSSLQ